MSWRCSTRGRLYLLLAAKIVLSLNSVGQVSCSALANSPNDLCATANAMTTRAFAMQTYSTYHIKLCALARVARQHPHVYQKLVYGGMRTEWRRLL